ncbi:hypothetical protein [Corynebacterium bovis]|uniref:hypothetical protein n=1 Tax=Corynebacterium bovis TaxID=36808 RepID=UPI00307FDCBF
MTSPTDGATLEVQSEVDPGGSITVRGAGWGAGVTPAPVVTLKLNYTLPAPDGRSGQYSRSTGVLDHPVTGRPEPTIWQLVTVRPDGTFEATVDLPTDGGVPVVPGQKLTVNAAAGLTGPGADAARATRSLISAPVTVGGVPWVEPERPTVSCTPSTPETLVEVAHVPDAEGRLRVSGTGWCNPTHGGATIALKIDDGAFSRLPETKVHDNLTVWQIVKADLSGNWSVDIDLPDGTTAGPRGSNPALPPPGEHWIRILSGSLQQDDPIRTIPSPAQKKEGLTSFVVGEYKPGSPPDPVNPRSDLTDATRHGVTATRRANGDLVVTVPGAVEGDWIYATAYIADGSPRHPWPGRWFRAAADGTVTLPAAGTTLPDGTVSLVLQSGNRGQTGTLLGWVPVRTSTATPTDPDWYLEATGIIAAIQAMLDGVESLVKEAGPDPATTTARTAAPTTPATAPATAGTTGAAAADAVAWDATAGDTDPGIVTWAAPATLPTVPAWSTVPAPTATTTTAGAATTGTTAQAPADRPATPPAPPAPDLAALTGLPAGQVTATLDGNTVTLTLADGQPGDWVFPYVYDPDPVAVDWIPLDGSRSLALDVSSIPDGDHRIALVRADGSLAGWVPVVLTSVPDAPVATPAIAAAGIPTTWPDDGLTARDGLVIAVSAAVTALAAAAAGLTRRRFRR